ncbi:lysozyme inhibitor LprI family protein [Rhizomicrobium palustre]|nr:lysozyme inhibitor LprI family protein [Rhizomicrobium palustre]
MRHSLWASMLFCGVALAGVEQNVDVLKTIGHDLHNSADLTAKKPAPGESDDDRLNEALYAGDFAKAKAILSAMLAGGGKKPFFADETMATIDRCIAAGKTLVVPAELKAIAADPRNSKNFSADDTVTAAVALANGWGVAKDRKRATALICHSQELTIAEFEGMTKFLTEKTSGNFLFCDHVTSGLHAGACEGFTQDNLKAERDRKLAQLTDTYTSEQKSAFAALRKAAQSYFEAHAGDEQDMSGTLRGAFYTGELGAMDEALSNYVNKFENHQLPPADDFAAADAKLNALYRKVMKETDWSDQGSVTADGVRGVQRRWIKYRDAWAVFGPLRYPGTTADQWKAWATRQRVKQLEAGFAPFGAENR